MMRTNTLRNTCYVCGKSTTMSFNRPKSQHKTKRVVKPNLQKLGLVMVCTRCSRSLKKATA